MPLFRSWRPVSFAVLLIVVVVVGLSWSHLINSMMPADSRPSRVPQVVVPVTPEEFETIVTALEIEFPQASSDFTHVGLFREEGILSYDGPATCLECHETLDYTDAEGQEQTVKLMSNLTDSAHYRFFTKDHDNVWGFNGKKADNFAMGKLNRPCPKPGSFAMTDWAETVTTADGNTLSEGCGQCHIGGQYQAPRG